MMDDSTKEMLGGVGLAGAGIGGIVGAQHLADDAVAAHAAHFASKDLAARAVEKFESRMNALEKGLHGIPNVLWGAGDALDQAQALTRKHYELHGAWRDAQRAAEYLRSMDAQHAAKAPALEARMSRGTWAPTLGLAGSLAALGGIGLGAKGLYDHFHEPAKTAAESSEDRPFLLPHQRPMVAGSGLLSAAGALAGAAAPGLARAKEHGAALSQAVGDASMLEDVISGMGRVSPEAQLMRAQLEHRAEQAADALGRNAFHAKAAPYMMAAAVPLGIAGVGMMGKGLYDYFHKEGAAKALYDFGLSKIAMGMTLQFDSPQAAQEHMQRRNWIGGMTGGLLGAGALGAIAGKRFGVPGALVGGAAGGLLGSIPGRLVADYMYDVPHRTVHTYEDTMQRLNAAGGGNIRVAEALSLEDFTGFAQEDAKSREDGETRPAEDLTGFQTEQMKRERAPSFGPPTSLGGGDAGAQQLQIGLPTYGGV